MSTSIVELRGRLAELQQRIVRGRADFDRGAVDIHADPSTLARSMSETAAAEAAAERVQEALAAATRDRLEAAIAAARRAAGAPVAEMNATQQLAHAARVDWERVDRSRATAKTKIETYSHYAVLCERYDMLRAAFDDGRDRVQRLEALRQHVAETEYVAGQLAAMGA